MEEYMKYSTCTVHCNNSKKLFSCKVVSNSLWPQGLQHATLLYPPLSPGVCSNSCPLSWWCYLTISSSVTSFSSSCPQTFPASESFPVSQLFASRGRSIRALASSSVLPMYIQGWFPLGLTVLIFLLSMDSQESSPASQFERIYSSGFRLLYCPTLTSVHNYWKNNSFDYMDLCWQSDVFAFYYAA